MNWLGSAEVTLFHGALVKQYGGLFSKPRTGALTASLSRPQTLHAADPGKGVPELAAAYAWEFARNQVFADGNQRLALATCGVFQRINAYEFRPTEVEAAWYFGNLVNGEISEPELTDWILGCSYPTVVGGGETEGR